MRMKEVPRGGRVWFAVESKSFKILIDEVGGCWLELRLVAEVEMKKAGPMLGRRREGVTGWRVVQMRREDFSFALEVQKKEKELEPRTYADVTKSRAGRIGDKVWLEVGRRVKPERFELLDRCLVGRWENGVNPSLELDFLKHWAGQAWLLKGKLNIGVLGGGLLLFEFECLSEAERVLSRGKRRVKDNVLFMEKWHPKVGCFCNEAKANEAWVRVVGLPLHLWSRGLIAVDEKTDFMADLQWARLLVKVLVEGSGCFSVQLWWEIPPWFSQVVPMGSVCGKGDTKVEDEAGSGSGVVCRGSVLEKEAQLVAQAGVQSEPPCGSSLKGATVFSPDPAARGHGLEATNGEDRLENRGQGAGKVVKGGGVGLGPVVTKVGPDSGEAQIRSGLGEERNSPGMAEMGCGLATEGIKGVRAHSLSDEAEMEARATEEASRAGVRDDVGAFPTESRALLTDEALTAEASRGTSGLDETVVGVGYQTPLCAVLKDGSPWVMDSVKEKSKGNNMSDAVEVMQERVNLGNKWDESSLVKFSKALGFSTEGPRGGEIFGVGSFGCQGCSWRAFSNAYLVYLSKKKMCILGRIRAIRWLWNDPWCIGGDFNMISFQMSARGGKVVEGPPLGGPHWSGGLNTQTMSRIDRFLVTEDREGYFNGYFILAEKLKALKVILKSWNKDVFGKVGVNKKLALDKVDFWDNQEKGAKIKRSVVEGGRQKYWIDGEEAARLEEAFTKEEVFSVLSI
ncbi:hypothetical protein AAG906_008536 [Vitis piasezkii]